MFKKPAMLLSWQAFPPISKTSSSHSAWAQEQNQQHRSFAMVSKGRTSKHNHGNLRWPEISSVNSIPTPYQIFNQKKGSPYSKKRFYELVKLYHPDKHDAESSDDGLSYSTKLERYRLVVAANHILSDPVRRGAYDYYGAGWNGQPDVKKPRDSSEASTEWGGSGWYGGPRGPSQNATWEDWEKWYQRDSREPQEPRFVSNSAFVSLILTFAVLGGIGQATRAGKYGQSFIEQRDALHKNVSKDLVRRRRETMNAYSSREERIDSFLRQRDPVGHGLMDPRDESYRKLLPTGEVCSSKGITNRPMGIYHENGPKEGQA